MRRSVADVLTLLRAERVVTDVVTDVGSDDAAREALRPELADEIPWYLRVVVGFAAWISTGLLLLPLIVIAGLDDDVARMVVGALLIGGAVFARREMTGEFLRWAAVALALAGQGLIVAGVAQTTDSPEAASVTCLALSVLLVGLIRDDALRFLATLAGAGSLVVAFVAAEAPQGYDVATLVLVGAVAWVWRVRLTRRSDELDEALAPVGYGLVVVLFGAMLVRTMAVTGQSTFRLGVGRSFAELGPLATIGCTAALLALTWKVLEERGIALSGPRAFALLTGAVAFGLGTLDSPGVVAGTAALMLAFDRRDRQLLVLAIVFLLTFGSLYYYSLDLTLLQKSGVLATSGLLLLGVRSRLTAGGSA